MKPTMYVGDCNDYSIDITSTYMIASFSEVNRIVIINLETMTVAFTYTNANLNLQKVWLGETGCSLATLNECGKEVQTYIFEWTYSVKESVKPTKMEFAVNSKMNTVLASELKRLK